MDDTQKAGGASRRKPRRGPKPVTRERLERAALAYLERFASSAENLSRVLRRRLLRAGLTPGDPAHDEALSWIEELVARYRRSGLLDDRVYAEAQAASLSRRGVPQSRIAKRLAVKGVEGAAIDAALAELREESGDADLRAALALARRRRLGPYRRKEARAELKQKDLATLARAGFSYEVARRVVEAESAEELEAEAKEIGSA